MSGIETPKRQEDEHGSADRPGENPKMFGAETLEHQHDEYGTEDQPHNRKRKSGTEVNDNTDATSTRLMKRIVLSLTKPSYILGIGSKTIRAENRIRLSHLLRRLVRQRNWTDASGVLSVLLKGTCKDRSPISNRFKYSASMELLDHMGGDYFSRTRIKNIYDVWMRKLGSMRIWPIEHRFAVHVEFVLFCLSQGNVEDAYQAALGLMQEREFGKDPVSNLIVGLTYRHLWFSTIPKEMQWVESEQFHTTRQTNELHAYSERLSAVNAQEAATALHCDSDTSIVNGKMLTTDADSRLHREPSAGVDDMQTDTLPQNFQTQDFYANSAESTGNEAFMSNHGDQSQNVCIFSALEGLDLLLLPLRLPHSKGNFEELFYLHRQLLNDYYKDAVKYLRLALYSTPPMLASLLPLIQLLLIGGQVDEALDELEKFCSDSNTALPIRLRARLLEHFDCNNSALLSTCFEDNLKKDPTCCYSLAKLVSMHQNGDYSPESLLEMIAMHLDATYADFNTWREFALCFLKLSQHEDDRVSVCLNEDGYKHHSLVCFSKTPKIFTEGKSGKSWRLRCRWWLTRHFSHKILSSEILAGDFQLLTHKAACAAHMYGEEFDYVAGANTSLKETGERDLLLFLQMNIQSCVGFYSNFRRNTN
ncbi:uncharacterized protein LOC107432494 isoform X1 [Ziziphus jujuba]|uniref:Uncharacterized protein LOC107432494 isoform X1 n=2 Tax=Ziziphus jujuba TaxID=326968 RepID=A0A6P4BJ30_ZIZJJ|nr:uncharacterized protein LOC107432494 isoform X1 [Ziziphus jujuba]XP_048321139.2 uncharacterized protein LOC107432494 isoform X1 [Ziziphus jujuba]